MRWFKLIQGHILDVVDQIEDESIDCIVTSPPYWGLRDYGEDTNTTIWGGRDGCPHDFTIRQPKGGRIKREEDMDNKHTKIKENQFTQKYSYFCSLRCGAWKGQLGLELEFNLYIQHLVDIFEALKPKLKKGGSLWINLGDTYYGGGNAQGHTEDTKQFGSQSTVKTSKVQKPVARGGLNDIKNKSVVGIPSRFKIAMIDKGWICRNEVIWHKNNPMPSSVKDRFTVDFEKFFFFTKNRKYYFKQQLEPMKLDSLKRERRAYSDNHKYSKGDYLKDGNAHSMMKERDNVGYDGIQEEIQYRTRNKRTTWSINTKPYKEAHFAVFPEELVETPIDACCPEGGIVLDPFNGSGTTGVVALKQLKSYIGVEINPDYLKIANKRLSRVNLNSIHDMLDFEELKK